MITTSIHKQGSRGLPLTAVFTVVSGVVLAVAAFSAVSGEEVAATKQAPRNVSALRVRHSTASAYPGLTPAHSEDYRYYLVASEAQKDAFQAAAADQGLLTLNAWFLVIRTPQDERSAFDTQRERTMLGDSAEIIDLRAAQPVTR